MVLLKYALLFLKPKTEYKPHLSLLAKITRNRVDVIAIAVKTTTVAAVPLDFGKH